MESEERTAKQERQLARRLAALDRVCAQAGLEPLPRSARARSLLVLHGAVSSGRTHAEAHAALADALVARGAELWHSECGLWTFVRCPNPGAALAAFDRLHARTLAALPRHALVAALVDDEAVGALVARERASLAPVEAEWVPGLRLLEGYVDCEAHAALVGAIDSAGAAGAWEVRSEGGRKVQHYGLRFDYATVRADTSSERPPWPEWCAALSARLVADGIAARAPNQVTVNNYEPGEGIPWHCDTHSAFGPVICSLSLLAETVMRFRPARAAPGEAPDEAPALGVRLPPRSLLVLSGDARYGWEHGIAARGADFHRDGLPHARARRLSVTFRTVGDAAPCACRWPQLCDSRGSIRLPRETRAAARVRTEPAVDSRADGLQLRPLRRGDAAALAALAAEQSWDSAQADPELALDLAARDRLGTSGGLGFFCGGALVSCAVALRLDAHTVWLSSVITQRAYRRRGLARGLVRALLARSERDAFGLFGSALGQPLYRSLGFQPLQPVPLFERSLPPGGAEPSSPGAHVSALSRAELEALLRREAPVRAAAMRAWFTGAPGLALAARSGGAPPAGCGGDVAAWALCRRWLGGAVFVGPLFGGDLADAAHAAAVRALLAAVVRAAAADVRPDGARSSRVLLLLQQPAGRTLVGALGFEPVDGAEVQFMLRPPGGERASDLGGVQGLLSGARLPPGEVLACGFDLA